MSLRNYSQKKVLKKSYKKKIKGGMSPESTPLENVVWLSINPEVGNIDFYSKNIAILIEKKFQMRKPSQPSECVLDSNSSQFIYYRLPGVYLTPPGATIKFHPAGDCYQTTPGRSLGGAGYEKPGWRSVKRVVVPQDGKIKVYSKRVRGEWRLAANELDSEIKFEETIPTGAIIEVKSIGTSDLEVKPQAWTGNDLFSDSYETQVVVWQWCRDVSEKQGDPMRLDDEWWCPYLMDTNRQIEQAYSENTKDEYNIKINVGDIERTIMFRKGHIPTQYYEHPTEGPKERWVRRKRVSIQELQEMIRKMHIQPFDLDKAISNEVPHQFLCPISQDIMNDPVKTVDGHTYDRVNIENWFITRESSPLTGLRLLSKTLVPNVKLKGQINIFKKQLQAKHRSEEITAAPASVEAAPAPAPALAEAAPAPAHPLAEAVPAPAPAPREEVDGGFKLHSSKKRKSNFSKKKKNKTKDKTPRKFKKISVKKKY